MSFLRTTLLNLLLLSPVAAFAGVTGTYQVSGHNPGTHEKYTGTVVITKEKHDIYRAVWTFSGGGIDVGTGVKKRNSIAFVFTENVENPSDIPLVANGTQLYKIHHHRLSGPWVRQGGDRKGYERGKKISNPS